jgi:Mg-chelatase subunit ChlD
LNGNGLWDPGEWYFGDPPPIPGNSRWSGVCAAMQIFLSELQTTKPIERISIVKFNHEATLAIDFTNSYSNVMTQVNQISPNGATAIGSGIELGANQFLASPCHRSWAAKVMIILTDGQSNYGIDPIVAAEIATNQGITLHTVSFTSFGSPCVMEQIADIGGGVFTTAANNIELKDAFKKIVASMPILLIE